MEPISIGMLHEHLNLLPTIASWFEREWPDYYGTHGKGNALEDLTVYSNGNGSAPFGLVAFFDDKAYGFMALKKESFITHPQLGPWVGAAYVMPGWRRRGIGAALLQRMETSAQAMNYSRIYCATATAATLLERCGWTQLETVQHEDQQIGIYQRALIPMAPATA